MQDFETRQKTLFDCLDNAEKSLGNKLLIIEKSESYERTTGDEVIGSCTKFRKNKESLFKRPELPLTKCLKSRKTPDYKLNPHKWKKYSLEDIDISDRTNSSAAFSFLKEIEQRNIDENDDHSSEGENKALKPITFKKVRKLPNEVDETLEKTQFKGSKLCMPQYVVGQKSGLKKTKQKPNSSNRNKPNDSLKLSHLEEDEEL